MPEELFDVLLADYLRPECSYRSAHSGVSRCGAEWKRSQLRTSTIPRSRVCDAGVQVGSHRAAVRRSKSTWAEQAYGWGVEFQSDSFIRKLAQIFEYMGGFAEIREMSAAQTTCFMPHLAASPVPPTFALAPILKSLATFTAGGGSYAAANEIGLAFLPVSGKTDATRRSDSGIAIAPYTEGSIADTIELAPNKQIKLSGKSVPLAELFSASVPAGPRSMSASTPPRSPARSLRSSSSVPRRDKARLF